MNRINKAFADTPRQYFLPPETVDFVHIDNALAIGYAQTNSQPSTVEKMLEWLDVEPGQKVLDVGSGSGWTSALLSRLTGKNGKIIAIEIVPDLLEFGRGNCEKLGINNVEFHLAATKYGWPKQAPYARILVSASADEIPQDLVDQLLPGGRMVIPVRHSILAIDKDEDGELDTTVHPGFVFVPLLTPT